MVRRNLQARCTSFFLTCNHLFRNIYFIDSIQQKILVITTTKTVIGAIGYPRKKEGWYPHAQFLPAAPQNCRAFPVLSCSYFICLVKCHFISSYQSHFRSQVISTQTFHISYRLNVQDH